jgi:hypothetical protein
MPLEVVMQTRALVATASMAIAASVGGCASAPQEPPAKAPVYFRSPPLDYREPGPTSSDGEVMGAHQRSVDDLILAGASSQRWAPGWQTQYGQLYFERERARAGYGVLVDAPACYPPPGTAPSMDGELAEAAPLNPEEDAALEPVEQDEAPEGYSVSIASMAAELRREQSTWLRCDITPAQ